MNRESIRRSALGAAVAAGIFGGVSLYRSLLAEGPLLDYLGPIGMMTVIGATVGGLVGPLLGEAWKRRRERKGTGRGQAAEGAEDGNESDHATPARGGNEATRGGKDGAGSQPLWSTLFLGVVVGFGIGTAWGRIWLGVALGLVLALASHRIFQ